ncbi:hypothetical protein OU995_26575 [Roseateles sp. SL47]|uniref:hypothetical protein n=1 Tax=Roseateles sp. SL47 TaxID=2995138 RepID=UPI00226EFA3F|nr:hypothetical protein [Roseateles sp. SL47]WAC73031.1 hypothetical protein OU995_26575 [Roseateles sp. SL47]
MNCNVSPSISLSGSSQPSKPEDENADPVGDPSTNQEPEDEDEDGPVDGDSNAGAERTGNGGKVQKDVKADEGWNAKEEPGVPRTPRRVRRCLP